MPELAAAGGRPRLPAGAGAGEGKEEKEELERETGARGTGGHRGWAERREAAPPRHVGSRDTAPGDTDLQVEARPWFYKRRAGQRPGSSRFIL